MGRLTSEDNLGAGAEDVGEGPSAPDATSVLWRVVGGAGSGGLVVRQARGTSSVAAAQRLAAGSLVRARKLHEGRLLYRLLAGTGPSSGWVSLRASGRALLEPVWMGACDGASRLGDDFVAADSGPPPPFATHQLMVPFPQELLPQPLRILEAVGDVSPAYFGIDEEEAHGALVWPLAYVGAEELLRRGVAGRSVLELGCGCGLISLAARQAGAKAVMATDRNVPNLQLVLASAQAVPGVGHFAAELLDVADESLPLPSASHCYCGNDRVGPYAAECGAWLPERFDYVVMADVLYDPACAEAFGARAAQAIAVGSTVILADPLRQFQSFQRGFTEEAGKLGLPASKPRALGVNVPARVEEWCAEDTFGEVATLNPSLLVLEPPAGRAAAAGRKKEPARDLPPGRWQDFAFDAKARAWVRLRGEGRGAG